MVTPDGVVVLRRRPLPGSYTFVVTAPSGVVVVTGRPITSLTTVVRFPRASTHPADSP